MHLLFQDQKGKKMLKTSKIYYMDDSFIVGETLTYDEVKLRTADYSRKFIKDIKKKNSRLIRRRFFECFLLSSLITLLGLLMILFLMPQSELSEISRDNSNLKDQITEIQRELVAAEENANPVGDIEYVKAKAIELGMQEPNANQVITLPLPHTDTLKTVNSEVDEKAFITAQDELAEHYQNIE